jgi:hypothetical protein
MKKSHLLGEAGNYGIQLVAHGDLEGFERFLNHE